MKKLLLLFLLLPFSINAQMVAGDAIPEFNDTFSCGSAPPDSTIHTSLIASSIPGNVLWPQEQVQLTLQFENTAARSIHIDGWLDILAYGTRGRPGDIWTPEMFKIADIGRVPFTIELAAGDFTNLSLQPHIPETFGAYGIVADCGQYGRRFITSCVRTFAAPDERLQYPSFCLDDNSPELLRRLGTHAIRIELNYKPTTDPDFEVWYERLRKRFLRYQQNNITVLVKISAPEPYGRLHPMGVTRPHLDDHGVMLNTKCDMAWLPQFDDDFKSFCYRIACDFGWPRGPINAFSLWNEPWEGLSISGWGADMLRYREIFVKMSEAIVAASEDAQVEILLGGGSSTSNALDKFFSEGTDDFLELYDFCSIHYQGMQSWATIKKWLYRSSERGRVRIWDTESWVANTDDRVAAVVAANKAAGYDRAMGIYGGNICQVNRRRMRTEQGLEQVETVDAWPVAASVGAVQHFIGERRFKELLFPNGLPWIMVFDGLASADDGCVVVVGDLGEEFGADNMLFRTVRGLAEINHKEQLQLELDRLDPQKEAGKIGELLRAMNQPEVLLGASLTLTSDDGRFLLYDFYGNPAPAKNGKITIPLDHRGFFLRTDGSAGSFAHLLEALRGAEIHGYEPFEMIAFDLSAPPSQHPTLHLKLTNMLNRPVSGRLKVQVEGLELTRPSRRLRFAPHETRQLFYRIRNGNSSPDNIYPLELCFNAGTDGKAVHSEELHVNQISLRKIVVDGDLNDWSGACPQIIRADQNSRPSLTEAAWYPFKSFDSTAPAGLSAGYLAYDDSMFYFAAKIADDTPDDGMIRFSDRDDDAFYYPDTSFIPTQQFTFGGAMKHDIFSFSIQWNGQLRPAESGDYTISLLHDDHVRFTCCGQPLLDANHGDSPLKSEARISLKRGEHYPIELEYRHDGGDTARIKFCCEKIDEPNGPTVLSTEMMGKYYAGPEYNVLMAERVDAQIDFTWNAGSPPHPIFQQQPMIPLIWPQGVRRYSYRRDPELPAGNAPMHDNVQIAFNVLAEEDKELLPHPPGVPKGFTNYQCSDYEYALNPVAEQFGGGVEIWRLRKPGLPHKHYYPRQPSSPREGAVADGQLVVRREGQTRIVEMALPWDEIPVVHQRLLAGKTIKFSYRVNDNGSSGTMELARGRSVSKLNPSFYVDWREHWANELEFYFEKK